MRIEGAAPWMVHNALKRKYDKHLRVMQNGSVLQSNVSSSSMSDSRLKIYSYECR